MPDPTRKTVSASQAAGLFNASKWTTRLGLYHWLKTGLDIDGVEDERMRMGKLLEDDILTLVQDRYHLDVRAVQQGPESYVVHPEFPVGCTLDAWCSCPTRGKAIVEAKNVDTKIFYAEWSFDDERECIAAPPDIEIQVQTEMLAAQTSWGIIAALVGGNRLVCLERKPDPEVQRRVVDEARSLLADVAAGKEPPAQGYVDYKIIERLTPETFSSGSADLRSGLDGKGNDEAFEITANALAYDQAKAERLRFEKEEKRLKGLLLDVSRRHDGAGYIMMDEGSVSYSRGKDTLYKLPPEVNELLDRLVVEFEAPHGGFMPKVLDEPNTLEMLVEAVSGLEYNVSRKGSVTVKWKEYEG